MLITLILNIVALFTHQFIPSVTSSSQQPPPESHAFIAIIFAFGATPSTAKNTSLHVRTKFLRYLQAVIDKNLTIDNFFDTVRKEFGGKLPENIGSLVSNLGLNPTAVNFYSLVKEVAQEYQSDASLRTQAMALDTSSTQQMFEKDEKALYNNIISSNKKHYKVWGAHTTGWSTASLPLIKTVCSCITKMGVER